MTFSHLSQKIKLIVEFSVAGAVAAGISFFFLYPYYRENATLMDETQSAYQKLRIQKQTISSIESLKKDPTAFLQDYNVVSSAFVDRTRAYDFISRLEAVGAAANVKLKVQSSTVANNPKKTSDEENIQLVAEGDFEHLREFLARLEYNGVFVNINQFTFEKKSYQDPTYPYQLTLALTFFYQQ